MSANEDLPVILVSAVNAAAASEIISEIIDDGSPGGRGDGGERGEAAGGAVWRLRNKYYSAAARLLPLPDGAAPAPGLDVQAHVIYLTEDECSDGAACAAMGARGAAARVSRRAVRLVAARAHAAPALARWARERHYELVALLAPAPDPDDEAATETRGILRVREALHAHVWPGLRRAAPPRDERDSDSDSSWGSWTGADEAGAQRAELFADALAQLPARRPLGAAAADADADDASRRLHAEQLVVAFCRALGHELRLDAPEGGEGGAPPEGGEGGEGQ